MAKETVTFEKATLWKVSTGILALVVIFMVLNNGSGSVGTAPSQPSAPSAAPTINPSQMKTLEDDDPVKGDANAPVTIIEFSDFECPFCGRFYSQTLPSIQKNFIDTGKVRLVYRDFPLSFHPQAQKAAEASECADDQDKFWEYHDLLFESGVAGGIASFKAYAGQLGLDQATFDSCLDSGKHAQEVQADLQQGSAAGIRGTPGFIINGQIISGAQPYQVFEQAINAALAE